MTAYLDRALAHLGTCLVQDDPFLQRSAAPHMRMLDKLAGEAALLLLLVSRAPNLPHATRTRVGDLVRQLEPLVRSEEAQRALLRFPYVATEMALGHIVLSLLGAEDEAYDRIARRAIASERVTAAERCPFDAAGVAWVRSLLGEATLDIPPGSVLESGLHPIFMTHGDAYAFTHGLFYVTDFGTRPLPPTFDAGRVAATIDAGVAWHLLTGDLDLLGEFLLCAATLQAWSPYAAAGWELLTAAWDDLGFLPGPTFEIAAYQKLPGDKAGGYVLEHCYHTTLVGGMLCARLLARYPGPPGFRAAPPAGDVAARCLETAIGALEFCDAHAARPDSPASHGTLPEIPVDRVLPLRSDETIPQIAQTLKIPVRSLTELQPAATDTAEMAVVVSDALLIHAARGYDLALLGRTLLDRAQQRLPVTPTLLAAANFLTAQQLPSGAIGLPPGDSGPDDIARTAFLAQSLLETARSLSL